MSNRSKERLSYVMRTTPARNSSIMQAAQRRAPPPRPTTIQPSNNNARSAPVNNNNNNNNNNRSNNNARSAPVNTNNNNSNNNSSSNNNNNNNNNNSSSSSNNERPTSERKTDGDEVASKKVLSIKEVIRHLDMFEAEKSNAIFRFRKNKKKALIESLRQRLVLLYKNPEKTSQDVLIAVDETIAENNINKKPGTKPGRLVAMLELAKKNIRGGIL